MEKKRKFSCVWCNHIQPAQQYCTRFPKWVFIAVPIKHFCAEHTWNKEARIEIRDEIMKEI